MTPYDENEPSLRRAIQLRKESNAILDEAHEISEKSRQCREMAERTRTTGYVCMFVGTLLMVSAFVQSVHNITAPRTEAAKAPLIESAASSTVTEIAK